MNIELVTISQNQYDVLMTFAEDYVREDHYMDGAGIGRFSASTEEFEGEKIINVENREETEANIKQFITALNSLRIRPYRVFIDGGVVDVEWYSNGWQIITSRKNYLELSLEFAKYIDSLYFCKMLINTGSFDDDPFYKEDMGNTHTKNYNSHFTKDSFGNDVNKEIEVMNHQYL